MKVLMACVLDDPNTAANGRSGQPQCGVDIYGYRDGDVRRLVGVQCKKKLDARVTETELRAEVKKAKKFKPKLAEFILATTAPRDQAIQQVARTITKELASSSHRMTVVVWGWEDIEENAAQYDDAINAFDPTFNPYAKKTYEKLEYFDATIRQSVDKIRSDIQLSLQPKDIDVDAASDNTPLHGQITAYIDLINEGHVQAVVVQIEKLKTKEWSKASRSERYRLTVAMAAAKLKDEDCAAAGRYLLDAYSECPEHRKAKRNRAKGYLLLDDHSRAKEIALDAIADDPTCADAASTLIQARLRDAACKSPLDDIPSALLETDEVLTAHVHFLRCRDDPAWLPLARQAAKKHPSFRQLRIMAAESILEELTLGNRDVMAGAPLTVVTQEELQKAVATLKSEALTAIERGFKIMPSLANNVTLALRFIDDIPTALRILDASILQHPKDENLRFQRAILAYAQNDMTKVLDLVPENPTNPEAVPMRATALADTGKPDEALKLIDGFDASAAPEHVKIGVLAARCHAYLVRNDPELAVNTARKEVIAAPNDAQVAAVLIRTYYLCGDNEAASKALDEAFKRIDDTASMSSRMLLSFEAQRLRRNDIIVALLKGRVATDHTSEALEMLIAAAINSRSWVTAYKTLESIDTRIQDERWFQRARAILAINTGSPDVEQRVGAYLKKWPNDASMVLVRVGVFQKEGRDKDIASFFSSLDFDALEGSPATRIRVASIATRHGAAERALDYAYCVLMDHWDDAKAHLAYQHVVLLNDEIGSALPPSNVVAENTAVHITGEDGDRWYRLEKRPHKVFEDQRLELDDDLAKLLLGRKVGESIQIQDHVGAKPVTIQEIKPIQLDALHRSLEQFNERFPRAKGMIKLTFDATAADPVEDMRAIARDRAEADQSLLEHYRSSRIPLAFVAGAMGRDPLEAWAGLQSVNVPFHVCSGAHQERGEALRLLAERERKGCVLDAITLSEIRRLNVAAAVVSVCGPLHAPQSVLDLLAQRAIKAKMDVGKKMGFLSWRDGNLVMEEFTEEMLKEAADVCETERSWAFANVAVVKAMPKEDFDQDTRTLLQTAGHGVCDSAIAAGGSGLLLLSDDMGLRVWSGQVFQTTATWLQPVLMTARNEGHLTQEEYYGAVNTLASAGHVYTSIESDGLMHQARKDGFELSRDLHRLLDAIGGPTADLNSNCRVAAGFLNALIKECAEELKVMRIASQAFESMGKGRASGDQRGIVALIVQQIAERRRWFQEHALGWLVGHSIGMPAFAEILSIHQKAIEALHGAHSTVQQLWKTAGRGGDR